MSKPDVKGSEKIFQVKFILLSVINTKASYLAMSIKIYGKKRIFRVFEN